MQVDAFLIDLLTRFAWDEAGLEANSKRLPHAMADLMRPPLQVSRGRPFESFPPIQSMAPRPALGQIFLPERHYKFTAAAAPLIRQALCVARSIASLLCQAFQGPKLLKQAIRRGDVQGNMDGMVATLRRRTRPKEIRSLRTLHDATWLLD